MNEQTTRNKTDQFRPGGVSCLVEKDREQTDTCKMVMGVTQENKTGSGARDYGGGGCFLKGLPEHERFEQRPEEE